MSETRLGRCPRCKAYTLVAERSGIRVAVDIPPADALAFGIAVASGIDLYWVKKPPGRPSSVLGRYSGTPRPSWGPGGAQEGVQRLHAEHSCGAPARDMAIINVQRPRSALVTPGSHRGGPHPPDAPASASQAPRRPPPATPATRPPSEILGPCSICGARIIPGQPYWSITHGHLWVDGAHEECP